MPAVYLDYQPGVDLDSLTASFFSAGMNFDDWLADMQNAAKCLRLNFDFALIDAFKQSAQVKKLCIEESCDLTGDDNILGCDVLNDFEKCNCDNLVKNLSRTVFTRLLQSEAQVRGLGLSELMLSKKLLEKTLLQIIGFALAYKSMQIDNVFATPVSLSSGNNVWSDNEIKSDFSPQAIDLLVCEAAAAASNQTSAMPSAAAVAFLTTVVSQWSMPSFSALRKVGFGCGLSNLSNGVCRALFGELRAARFRSELISVLETNLDDLSPQVLSFATEELFAAGALDVFVGPVIMKKGRGGHLLTILCKLEDKEKLQAMVFAQTSTLGIRAYDCERLVAEREFKIVLLEEGHKIRIKIGFDLQGKIISAQPEYDDCASYARFSRQSVQEVMRLALTKFNDQSLKSALESVVMVIFFACFISLPVLAKSNATAVSSSSVGSINCNASNQAVQFSRTLRQANASSLKNEDGFEIYSWNVGGKWHYSLLPVSKEEKTLGEVTEYSVTLKSFTELEAALGKLAPCVVCWRNHLLKADQSPFCLSLPHRAVLNQLKKYCQNRQIRLVL